MSAERAPGVELSSHALFLDLDGTIARFEIQPWAVEPDARRTAILKKLETGLDGRLAVVSGRRIADIDRILDCQVRSVAGAHGLERRTDARLFETKPHPAILRAREAFVGLASSRSGLIVEMKELSVALHYRARPDLAQDLLPMVADIRRATGLVLQAGDCVFELRTPGPDKGDAVRAFMAQTPFAGARPVYLGDDLTDESAFRAVAALGGFGVLVGPPRPTAALYRLEDVEDALDWLDGLGPDRVKPATPLAVAHV